jgi:hypothetical protein
VNEKIENKYLFHFVWMTICGENEAAAAGDRMPTGSGAQMSEEQLLDTLDRLYPTWFERATGQPGAKRVRRA